MSDDLRIEDREKIRTLIARSGRNLDTGDYAAFIDLFVPEGHYTLEAKSPEIGADMSWLSLESKELAALLDESSQHVHDLAERSHFITTDEIVFDGEEARAVSSFAVFRTDQEGRTGVYAVGSYVDRLVWTSESGWKIADRRARVRTTMFRTPTPMPL